MSLSATALRQRIAAGTPTFSLGAAELGLPATDRLFTAWLPQATLTLASAAPGDKDLTVAGKLALAGVGGGGALDATVRFTATGDAVAALELALELDPWRIARPELTLDLEALRALTSITGTRLLLRADAGADQPRVGVEVDLLFPGRTETLALRGFEPPAGPDGVAWRANWELEADFGDGLGLGELTALATLPGVAAQDIDLTALEKVAGALDALALKRIGLVFDSASLTVMALHVDVLLKDEWTLVEGKCELTDIQLSLAVTLPTVAPQAAVTLSATVRIGEVPVAASISYPELAISAGLEEPVPAEKIFGQYLPEAVVDMDVERASLAFDATTLDWEVEFGAAGGKRDDGTAGGWRFADKVTLTEVSVSLAGTGIAPPDASCSARFDAGGIPILLAGSYDAGSWSLLGESVTPEGLHVGALLKSLDDDLGVDTPAAVAGMDLTLVKLEVSSGPSLLFICDGTFPVGAGKADFEVYLDVGPGADGKTLKLDSAAWLDLSLPQPAGDPRELEFDVTFDTDSGSTSFSALWRGTPALRLDDLTSLLGGDVELPDGLAFELDAVWLRVASDGSVIVGVDTAATRTLLATLAADAGPRAYVGAFELDVDKGLRDLPIVGDEIPPEDDLVLETVRLLASNGLSAAQVKAITDALPTGDAKMPRLAALPPGAIAAGVSAGAIVTAGGKPAELPAAPSPPVAPAAPSNQAPAAPGAWLDVGRSLGPLHVRRVGATFSGGRAWLLLDAGLSLGVLAVDCEGLGLGIKLDDLANPAPRLRGLSVALSATPIEIAGGLVDTGSEYEGELIVKVGNLTITALGAWTTLDRQPSLFVYALLDYPLGGPAFFYVTGLALGFGYNRGLVLPSLNELPAFPLVAAAVGDAPGSRDPTGALASLNAPKQWVPPQTGEDWLAVGVRFRSFNMLESFALLTVAFGRDVQVALLGITALTVPTQVPEPIAYAELALKATYSPTSGVIAIAGQLTPQSYVLSPTCRLTGGFAFVLWTALTPDAPRPGEFVLTLGGYHPHFVPPHGYPSVPRIGACWNQGALTVKADTYFALTPACVMAGGSLEAAWRSEGLEVTFNVQADFLLGWKPFHYEASASITITARLRVTIVATFTLTLHVGVWLELYGPPFAGRAHVDLDVVSFTIAFGQDKPEREPIPWDEFKKTFLPAETWCGTRVLGGLERDLASDGVAWVLNGERLALQTFTAVPATAMSLTSGKATQTIGDGSPAFGVGPVGIADGGLASEHVVTLSRLKPDGTADTDEDVTEQLAITAVIADQPRALWSTEAAMATSTSDPNQPATLRDMAVGLLISGKAVPPAAGPAGVDAGTLRQEATSSMTAHWQAADRAAARTPPAGGLAAGLADTAAAGRRAAIVAILNASGAALPAQPSTARLAHAATTLGAIHAYAELGA